MEHINSLGHTYNLRLKSNINVYHHDKKENHKIRKTVGQLPKKKYHSVYYKNIELTDSKYVVKCSSKDKGRDVMQACTAGCIGCGLCAKNCPNEAIDFEFNLAVINQDKCKNCGICAEKCPKKVIENI